MERDGQAGVRRRHMRGKPASFLIWATYLLLSFFAKIALGRLTVVRIDDPNHPGYDVVLQGLLAPLFLLQLGYPDGITAYAVEDNRLGLRQMLNVGATWCVVVWILFQCWDGSSPVSRLYIPLFVAGFIKSAGWVWVLKSVYHENSSMTARDIKKEACSIQQAFGSFPEDEKFKSAKDILKAYYWFDCLKPHLVNWLYHPAVTPHEWMSIDSYTADRAFTMTEIELNFMFDVLYTKAPILYTKCGLIGHFIGLFCLVYGLCGFSVIFRNAFLIDMHITYTYALLMAVTSVELYQITVLPFSDWAVVKMSMHLKAPLFLRLLPFLAKRCMKQRRWSRSVGQLNLLKQNSLYKERPKPLATVLDWFEKREIVRRYGRHSCQAIPSSLKTLVFQKMAGLRKLRKFPPFTGRDKWMLETHGIQQEGLRGSIETTFDRSIIIWHIATEILHILEWEHSDACKGSKLLSDYMTYLLALHPYMLSLATADITLDFACRTLRNFFRYRDYNEGISTLYSPNGDVSHPVKPSEETWITSDWHLLSEVQKLVADLKTMNNKWELISSIWVEMLCFAAYQCHVYHHGMGLRRGGELITHVWLLLAHKTN
ncbi:hypothetical protein EUGRSUZ_C01217 [Eucalyptus grandis]|uniref:DUF4220 domain-containing protein n=2 Tax=Eucalyptus grandis TaxID=71139 RepID=A0A059CNC1_EUCGR|nr:hypothetical protein EUGRSUZ_C01217 [Eucalyptus grandis]